MSEAAAEAPRFRRLLPPPASGEQLVTAAEALAGWRGPSPAPAPRVALNMVTSLDGRISVGGRSAPLSSPADRSLFHALRAEADAVMAGSGTVTIERYGPIIREGQVRERRRSKGLQEQPLAVIPSRRLDLDPDLPLLADPSSRIVLITPVARDLAPCAASIDYIRAPTLRAGLAELRAHHGVELVVCEGGPTLAAALAAESLIDELFLALAPALVGGDGPRGLLDPGQALPQPLALELEMLLEHSSQLYARYVRRSGAAAASPSS
jgi:riboflavin biosynthesis pyrimidine reductase